MTLSINQNLFVDPNKSVGAYSTSNGNSDAMDFSSILNMLLASSMGSLSGSDNSSDLQSMLLNLMPLFQNLQINTSYSEAPSGMPVQGPMTQEYHSGHQALDIGVDVGTSVQSTMSGVVKYAGWNNEGYGNLVIVDNGAYQTYYGHLDSIPVNVGDSINSGQVIGLSGNTGNSTGPHLHYEIRAEGKLINPTSYTYGKVSEYFV